MSETENSKTEIEEQASDPETEASAEDSSAELPEAEQEQTETSGPQEAVRKGHSFTAMLSLILVVVLIAAVAFMWQRLQVQLQGIDNRIASVSKRISGVEQAGSQQSGAVESAVSRLAATEQQMQSAMQEMYAHTSRQQGSWTVAEAEYLLALANYQVNLEEDLAAALTSLTLADERLSTLADPAIMQVRQVITSDMAQLRSAQSVDTTQITAALAHMISAIDDLPLATQSIKPQSAKQSDATEAVQPAKKPERWQDYLKSIWQEIRKLVVVRRQETTAAPMIPREQSYYLYQNLRLELQTARLAAMQRDDTGFTNSVSAARDWVAQYFDVNQPQVSALLEQLDQMQQQQVSKLAAPDISASLHALRSLMRQRSGMDHVQGVMPPPVPMSNVEEVPAPPMPMGNVEEVPVPPMPMGNVEEVPVPPAPMNQGQEIPAP